MTVWTPPDWRDGGVYAQIVAGGRQALAWELLRRDPAYRDFAQRDSSHEIAASRWGLHFRC